MGLGERRGGGAGVVSPRPVRNNSRMTRPMFHLLCGKAGAGKSTRTATLARTGAVPIVQDDWMAALFKDELVEMADYLHLMPKLRAAMDPHLVTLMRAGVSIVFDWPANTVQTRAWLADVARRGNAEARLYWLDTPDAVCLARVRRRDGSGDHPFTMTGEPFAELASYFEPPTTAEGLTIERIG